MPEGTQRGLYFNNIQREEVDSQIIRRRQNNRMLRNTIIGLILLVLMLVFALKGSEIGLGKMGAISKLTGDSFVNIDNEIDISQEPLQTSYEGDPIIRKYENTEFRIIPVAKYKLSAMVVGMKIYNPTDFSPTEGHYYFAMVSPIDLCVIWGKKDEPLFNDPTYTQLTYELQDRRCSSYEYGQFFFPVYLNNHLSNNHIIPANENISNEIIKIEDKEKIILSGFLVDVDGTITWPDNQKTKLHWKTSLTRYDSGDGACEIFYVTNATLGNKIYK